MKLLKAGIVCLLFWVQLVCAQSEEFVVSPVPPHDTLYQLERVAAVTEFSFAGFVKTNSGSIVATTVTLINKETAAEYSTTTTNSDNTFTITGIPQGNYILKGVPSSYPYLTTYFSSANSPINAYVFVIDGNIRNVQLYLLEQVVTRANDNNTNVSTDIFPNPFDQRLTINTITGKEIKIFNLNGKLLAAANTEGQTIDTSLWTSGLYLIQLENGTVLKFTKN